jgi:hypothetical protein
MSAKQDDLPFPLGKTYYQHAAATLTADAAASKLQGKEILGRVWECDDALTSASGLQYPRSSVARKVMAVRNNSGFAVLPQRLVTLELSGLLRNTNIAGYADVTNEQYAYPVDESLAAAGCPDDDICWIVIEGPALCLMSLSQVGDIAQGQLIGALTGATSGATTSGRVAGMDGTTTGMALASVMNIVGWAMSAVSSSSTNGNILVNVRRHH